MSSSEPDQTASVPGDLATANERAAEAVAGARRTSGPSLDLPPVARWGTGYLALLFLAQFVMSIAQLAPSTYSLAVRVQAMAPADKNTMLGKLLNGAASSANCARWRLGPLRVRMIINSYCWLIDKE